MKDPYSLFYKIAYTIIGTLILVTIYLCFRLYQYNKFLDTPYDPRIYEEQYFIKYLSDFRPDGIVPELPDLVNPFIGTAPSQTRTAGLFGKGTEELGQTIPAVLEPNGMNFWTPQTRDTEQKCIAPYYYTDSHLQGFRNSHWIAGGCTQDYGSMTLMPMTRTLRTSPAARATRIDKISEHASPYLYTVSMPDEGIKAEMTATSRAAIFRFSYDESGEAFLVVNPNSDEGEGYIEIDLDRRQIRGHNPVHRIYQGWDEPAGFSGWFVVEWERGLKVTGHGTFRGDKTFPDTDSIGNAPEIGAYISFKANKEKPVLVKAASSFTGMDGAMANLVAEIPWFSFDKVRENLRDKWKKQLGCVAIQNKVKHKLADLRKFYSALYRASFLPRTFSDADGSYPVFSKGSTIMKMPEGKTYYEDFSLWDTYRALHPLLNIISPEKSGEMMQSLVLKYEQGGWLPIFPCWNSYTAAMIGDHAIAAISDAYVKGIRGFDIRKAYEGMRKNAFESPADSADYRDGMGRRALGSYLKYGYIPVEDKVPDAFHEQEQVSRTLEYAFDDFALAQVAKALGKTEDYNLLMQRSGNYANVINPATGYAAPRDSSGRYLPSDPFSFSPYITEGAPCHYTWYVPHDQNGLMEIMGGKETYIAKLDSMFSQKRYWHGNEPCHQVAWLFSLAGQQDKTVKHVRDIMNTEYLDSPGGLSGNDDAGQMSAWYVFAALGFYPVCPGSDEYVIGEPAFPHMVLDLPGGKKFHIYAEGEQNNEIERIVLNGHELSGHTIRHSDIMSGGDLRIIHKPSESSSDDWIIEIDGIEHRFRHIRLRR